jgi:hypothetical protein
MAFVSGSELLGFKMNLLFAYAIFNVVVGLAVVAHHDYKNWQERKAALASERKRRTGVRMPWFPMTLQQTSGTAPSWSGFQPPTVDASDHGFYEELENGIVSIFYYNCGVRQEKFVTSNWRYLFHDNAELITPNKENSGTLYLTEENRVPSGETSFKGVVGWASKNKANPDLKSKFAAEWKKNQNATNK